MAVCPECEAQIEWVESPLCTCCGRMFADRDGADRVCGDCQTDPPPFARARAAALYDGPVAQAITALQVQPPDGLSPGDAALAEAPPVPGVGDGRRSAGARAPAPETD